jgi:TAT (twin-arginine translocation) pathway signal sequence
MDRRDFLHGATLAAATGGTAALAEEARGPALAQAPVATAAASVEPRTGRVTKTGL